jgi:hypothetical protein
MVESECERSDIVWSAILDTLGALAVLVSVAVQIVLMLKC